MKNLALEGLRGIASLNVVLGHFLFSFFPYLAHHVRPYPNPVARYWFEEVMMFPPFTFLYLADAAVSVFFVLSGYVLTQRYYETSEPRVFESAAVRRYVRLVFPAAASVIFAWALLLLGLYGNQLAGQLGAAGWVMAFYTEPVSFIGAVSRAFIGAPLFGQFDLNRPLWTIQIELIGSTLLFACYALFATRSKLLAAFWFLFLSFLISGRSSSILYYASILAGSFLHLAEGRLKASPRLSFICLALGLIGVSFTFAPVFTPLYMVLLPILGPYGPDLSTAHVLVWHSVGATLLVAGIVGSPFAARALARPIPVYLGRLSFSIYLLHFPLMMALSFRTAQVGQSVGMGYLGYVVAAFVITMLVLFVLAELFYRYIDAPSIRLARRLSVRRGTVRQPLSRSAVASSD